MKELHHNAIGRNDIDGVVFQGCHLPNFQIPERQSARRAEETLGDVTSKAIFVSTISVLA